MMMILFLLLVVPLSLLFLCMKVYSYLYDVKHRLVKKVPGYPLIGNLFDFHSKRSYATLQRYPLEYGPFAEFYIATMHAILITDIDAAREVMLRRPKLFRRPHISDYGNQKLGLTTALLNSEGMDWIRIRKSTTPSFSSLNISHKLRKVVFEMFNWMMRLANQTDVDLAKSEQEGKGQATKKREFDMKYESFTLTIRVITLIAFGLQTSDPISSYFFTTIFKQDIEKMFKFLRESTMFGFPKIFWKYSSVYYTEPIAIEANQRFTEACQKVIHYKRSLIKEGKNEPSMIDSLLVTEASAAATSAAAVEKSDDAAARAVPDNHPSNHRLLNDDEIVSNVKIFYLAGSDTTSVTISWVVYYFCLFPEILLKVRKEAKEILFKNTSIFDGKALSSFSSDSADVNKIFDSVDMETIKSLKYAHVVIKETLRCKGPVASLATEPTSEPVTLANGITIPAGTIAWINQDGIHHIPEIFDSPFTFQPERWLIEDQVKLAKMESAFLPFGGGTRICPGEFTSFLISSVVFLSIFLLFQE
jgi:cytochrome P450